VEFYGKVNFQGRTVYADYVTTVSKNIARKIQTANTVLALRECSAHGGNGYRILNGVDYEDGTDTDTDLVQIRETISAESSVQKDLLANSDCRC